MAYNMTSDTSIGTSGFGISSYESSLWVKSVNVSSPWNESTYNVSSPWSDYIQDYNQDSSMEVHGGPPDPAPLQHVATILRMYYQPVVAGLGVLINLVTMMILLYRPLRILSCNQYMLGVLISQIIHLVTLVSSSLTDHGYSIYTLGGFCQLTTFIQKGSSFMCLWCTVGLSVDGLIRVRHPDLEVHMCTLWRARIYIISVCVISVVVHLNTSLTVALYYYPPPDGTPICHDLHDLMRILNILGIVNAFVNSLLPYTIMLVAFLLICIRLAKNEYQHRMYMRNVRGEERRNRPLPSHGNVECEGRPLRNHGVMECDSRPLRNLACDDDAPPGGLFVAYFTLYLLFSLPMQGVNLYLNLRYMADNSVQKSHTEYFTEEIVKVISHTTSLTSLVLVCFYPSFRYRLHHILRMLRLCQCCPPAAHSVVITKTSRDNLSLHSREGHVIHSKSDSSSLAGVDSEVREHLV